MAVFGKALLKTQSEIDWFIEYCVRDALVHLPGYFVACKLRALVDTAGNNKTRLLNLIRKMKRLIKQL